MQYAMAVRRLIDASAVRKRTVPRGADERCDGRFRGKRDSPEAAGGAIALSPAPAGRSLCVRLPGALLVIVKTSRVACRLPQFAEQRLQHSVRIAHPVELHA